jgi:nickel superoxide dismutase
MKRYLVPGCSLLALGAVATGVIWFTSQEKAEAHCQVPCGIYDDAARIGAMLEDATTIDKAITQIRDLANKHDAQSLNQATRWIMTKENHASHIMTVLSEYFLTQKVKPVAPGADGYDAYLKSLADHHAVLVAAMNTKQLTDPASVEALRKAIHTLARHYDNPPKSADAGLTPGANVVAQQVDAHGEAHHHGDDPAEHAHTHESASAGH